MILNGKDYKPTEIVIYVHLYNDCKRIIVEKYYETSSIIERSEFTLERLAEFTNNCENSKTYLIRHKFNFFNKL